MRNSSQLISIGFVKAARMPAFGLPVVRSCRWRSSPSPPKRSAV